MAIQHDPISDTSPEAEAVLVALLRKTPPWRKLQLMDDLNQTARQFALANLRSEHPNATDAQLHRLLADRILGASLAAEIYGPAL